MSQTDRKPAGNAKSANLRMAIQLISRIPLIFKVVLLHLFGLSEPSKHLDLKTHVTVAVLRSFLDTPKPQGFLKLQKMTTKDPGVKGRIWVSTAASQAPPEDSIREALLAAVENLKPVKAKEHKVPVPDIVAIEAEWTGYRPDATPDSPPPAISEEEKYKALMKDCKSPVTVLYLHGGAYYLLDPASHRPGTKKIAKLTQGRCYSVRYRLAPQNPFPSAILDALVSYFTLLYPPPGAFHEAVEPKDIVFAGDSAGGNLSLALLQTLLEIRRQNRKITWFGQERQVPLPAAVATNSPWLDMSMGFPSWQNNQQWDYLPEPQKQRAKPQTSDAIWPSNPPRIHPYVYDAFLDHPLACLQFAESWEGSPPIYVCMGWDCLADEGKWFVAKAHHQGIPVVLEEYEGQSHVFAMVVAHAKESRLCMENWANFIKTAVEDPQSIKSRFVTFRGKTCDETEIDVTKLSPYTDEDVRAFYQKAFESAQSGSAAEVASPKL